MRYAFIARHKPIWKVSRMCRLLTVSRSGFHEWQDRTPSARAIEDERLTTRIRTFHALSGRTYGSPRIWRDLVEAGERVGENRVVRLMHRAGIEALRRKKRRPVDEGVRPECSIAVNVLDREFQASAPNQKWSADFTYIDTAEGWLFLAVVIDLYSSPGRGLVHAAADDCAARDGCVDHGALAPRQAQGVAASFRPR